MIVFFEFGVIRALKLWLWPTVDPLVRTLDGNSLWLSFDCHEAGSLLLDILSRLFAHCRLARFFEISV